MCVLPECMSVYHVCTIPGGQKEVLLGLELQRVVSCHVGARLEPGSFGKQLVL